MQGSKSLAPFFFALNIIMGLWLVLEVVLYVF